MFGRGGPRGLTPWKLNMVYDKIEGVRSADSKKIGAKNSSRKTALRPKGKHKKSKKRLVGIPINA